MTFANDNGFAVCDLAPRIEPITENFVDEIHYTFKGSARVAEAVTECLKPLVGVPRLRILQVGFAEGPGSRYDIGLGGAGSGGSGMNS